jgi:spore germination cell wall hydrolase CwlJ-like protein
LSSINEEVVAEKIEVSSQALQYLEPFRLANKMEYMVVYNEIVGFVPQYSAEQMMMIYRCIETEVNGGDFDSKCNVASVIINRVNSDQFPNDPTLVVTSPKQFAYSRTEISEDTKLALEYVLLFGDTTNGAIGFRSGACPSTFSGWTYQFTDSAGHHFYK